MAPFAAEPSAIEARLATKTLLLTNKWKEPSLPTQLGPIVKMLAASKPMADFNAAVAAHDEIAKNITNERADLTGQVWVHILENELKAHLSAYDGKRVRSQPR